MKKFIGFILAVAMVLSVTVASPHSAIAVNSEEFNGVYYIRNAVVGGSFVDVEDASIYEYLKAHNLSSTKIQTWNITPIGNGYYKIVSDLSGYCLTVVENSTSSGASVMVSIYTGESGQQWSIEAYQDGKYSIRPKCNGMGYLSAPIISSSEGALPYDGTTLGIYHASNDARDQEYWYLHKMTDYTLVINAQYDDAYASRYGIANVASRITDNLLWLKRVMLQYAGVRVSFNVNYQKVDTYLDSSSCSANNTHTDMCSCGTCINSTASTLRAYHHTNCHNILYRLTNPNQAYSMKVVFSGHDMCEIRNLSHVDSTTSARTHSAVLAEKDIILMFDFYTGVAYHERMMMIYNIFELYGLSAHNNEPGDEYNDYCLFGASGTNASVVEMCTLCTHCQEVLKSKASKYNHTNS